jgi:hypothetical protein
MPKLRAFGTSLGLFSRSTGKATAGLRKKKQAASRPSFVEPLEDRVLLSTSYYVATWGNDASSGSAGAPFRTIQRAANSAWWGDTVQIQGGIYHETVTPPRSGVTFAAYNGQSVTIDGADPVGNFSGIGNGIYKTNIGWNMGQGLNQVFVDGLGMNDARWPNSGTDLSHPAQAQIQGISGGTVYNSGLNQPNGFWTGAWMHFTPGDAWTSYTGYVNNSGPGWINVSFPGLSGSEQPKVGNNFYLTGKFQGLDTNGEYYVDGSSNLYLRDYQTDNPAWHSVEVKRRLYAFDLANVANTTITGLNIFASTIRTGYNSPNTLIDHVNANYISKVGWISNGWSVPEPWGLDLMGNGSILQNSSIGNSEGDGVYIGGSNVIVRNNVIHDVDTSGIDAAGVRVYGQYATITGNTIYNTGRDGINFQTQHTTITNNTIHDAMLQTQDGGGIYTVNNTGQWSTIAGNAVYNVTAGGWGGAGIFLDNWSSNITVHDNNVWNVNYGIKLNFSSYNEQVYNNKFNAYNYSVANNGSYDWGGSNFYNNTFSNPNTQWGYNVNKWNNAFGSSASPTPTPPPAPAATGVSAGSNFTALNYNAASNVKASGGAVGYTFNNSWLQYNNIDFGSGGFSRFIANIAVGAGYAGQKIVLHVDGLSGPTIGTLVTTATGSWSAYANQQTSISRLTGVHTLYIQFVGYSGIANLLNFKFA